MTAGAAGPTNVLRLLREIEDWLDSRGWPEGRLAVAAGLDRAAVRRIRTTRRCPGSAASALREVMQTGAPDCPHIAHPQPELVKLLDAYIAADGLTAEQLSIAAGLGKTTVRTTHRTGHCTDATARAIRAALEANPAPPGSTRPPLRAPTGGQPGLHVRHLRRGWAVFDSTTRLTGYDSDESTARKQMEKIARVRKSRMRACLTCGGTFLSEGPHNRMCTSCRHRSLHDGYV